MKVKVSNYEWHEFFPKGEILIISGRSPEVFCLFTVKYLIKFKRQLF